MNTAKTLQLLDLQSNNISPATNIESIYYEVMDGGVIYRNSLYRHFPIYVKYNNNIDDPIVVNRSTNSKGIQLFNDTQEDTPIGNSPSFRLSQSQNSRNDIFVSSIRQSQLKNTRYYKLDISTYNFSDIMSLYAPKLWVKTKFNDLDSSIGKIRYDSSIITTYSSSTNFIRTTEAVGNIEKGTLGSDLTTTDIDGNTITDKHVVTVNEVLDKILFKEIYPYIFDASIYMEEVYTSGELKIANGNINDIQTNYKIITNPGKLQIVYNKDANTITPEPVNTKLEIRWYPTHFDYELDISNGNKSLFTHILTNNVSTYNINKYISFNDCYSVYNGTIERILEKLYNNINTDNIKKTPNIDYDENDADSIITWNTFEENVINTIKETLKNYFTSEELEQIDWKEIIIKNIYTDRTTQYPKKGQTIKKAKFQKTNAYSIDSSIGQCLSNSSTGIFTADKMFKNEYYVILKTFINVTSDKLNLLENENPADNSYNTNFGNLITNGMDVSNYIYGIYEFPYNNYNYELPYNDYNISTNKILDVIVDGDGAYKVNSWFTLYHKFIIYVPIIINNKKIPVTGAKEQYIDFLQNTAEDIEIKIPAFIDGADFEHEENLPELYAISQGGVFMPANNWEINSKESDAIYHIYTIKGQSPYDEIEENIDNKRTIKIKIHTKYSTYA